MLLVVLLSKMVVSVLSHQYFTSKIVLFLLCGHNREIN